MADGFRATLDNPVLRARLRQDFTRPGYIRRPTPRPQTAVLSDVLHQHRTSSLGYHAPVKQQPTPVAQSIQQQNHDTVQRQQHDQPNPIAFSQIHSQSFRRRFLTKLHNHISTPNKLQLALSLAAISMVVVGAYLSFLGFRANHTVQAQAIKLTSQANAAATATPTPAKPSTSALATVKPTAAAVAAYSVAPNLPKYLIIPKLGVDARILSVGVNAQGALETPDNVYDTAWYNESSEPGQPGAMLIDGHVSSWTAHGVFYGIKTLVAGDTIKVERGDGTMFTYQVVKSQVYPSGNVDMSAAITPVTSGTPGLNLITCTGDVIPGTSEFNERIVVFAQQVS